MPKTLNRPALGLLIIAMIALISTAPASLSSAAESGVDKLIWHETPKVVPDTPFQDGAGETLTLSDFKGKLLVVNLWATWCAPCIREMPTLDALEAALGGDKFHVIALSQDREGERVARPFIEKNGWTNLELYVSDGTTFGREAKVRGLPTTLVIAPDGLEVARLEGTAEWDSDEIKAVLQNLLDG